MGCRRVGREDANAGHRDLIIGCRRITPVLIPQFEQVTCSTHQTSFGSLLILIWFLPLQQPIREFDFEIYRTARRDEDSQPDGEHGTNHLRQPMSVLSDYSISPLCIFGTKTERNVRGNADFSLSLRTESR